MKYPLNIDWLNANKPDRSRLTVTGFIKNKSGKTILQCRCSCGKETTSSRDLFINGTRISCGCARIKRNPYIPKIIMAYEAMMGRCYNPKHISYPDYGGRGVVVCDEWRNSYSSFALWALNNGWEIGLQLDKDIKGSGLLYSPENCLWVTKKDNYNFKRSSVWVEIYGEKMTMSDLVRKYKITNRTSISYRISIGMSVVDAISKPFTHANNFKKSLNVIKG